MRMMFENVNRLIVIGLLVVVAGCASQVELPEPVEVKEKNALNQAVDIFHKAERSGARRAAPKSYQKARQALDVVMAVVSRSPGNSQGIQNEIEQFAFEADHLLHITNEVKELRSVQSQAIENVVLSAEYRLLAISDALKLPDPRRQKLYDQTVTIANAANKLISLSARDEAGGANKRRINKNELDEAYTRIKQLQLQLKSVKDDNNQLTLDQKSFKKRIESLERLALELNKKNADLEALVREHEGKLNKPEPPAG